MTLPLLLFNRESSPNPVPRVAGFAWQPDAHKRPSTRVRDHSDISYAKRAQNNRHIAYLVLNREEAACPTKIQIPRCKNTFLSLADREAVTRTDLQREKTSGVFATRKYQGPTHHLPAISYGPFPRKTLVPISRPLFLTNQ